MLQNELKPVSGSRKNIKRLWRWLASWTWKTAWRWTKGQKSRKWGPIKSRFEWGQTPLYQRLPKLKWFNNSKFGKIDFQCVNVEQLSVFDWKSITVIDLYENWLVSKKWLPCKILWWGDIKAKVNVKVNKISASAKDKIEKAGGKVELI